MKKGIFPINIINTSEDEIGNYVGFDKFFSYLYKQYKKKKIKEKRIKKKL